MSSELTDLKWRILYGDCNIKNNELKFYDESVIVREKDPLKNIEISANFLYKGSDIGVVLCYNNRIGYLLFSVNTFSCKLLRIPIISDNGEVAIVGEPTVLKEEALDYLLIENEQCSLKVERTGTNIKAYVDEDLVLSVEESLYNEGSIGLFGSHGEISTGIQVKQLFPSIWDTVEKDNGDIVCSYKTQSKDTYMYINKATSSDSITGIKQPIPTVVGQKYTIQCMYAGDSIYMSFAGEEVSNSSGIDEDSVFIHTFTATDTQHDLLIGLKGNDSLIIKGVQVEDKPYNTAYLQNDSSYSPAIRSDASLTYPSKNNVDTKRGSVCFWFKPVIDPEGIDLDQMPMGLFYYGDEQNNSIYIRYDGEKILYNYGDVQMTYEESFSVDEMHYIAATWDIEQGIISLFMANIGDLIDPENIPINQANIVQEVNIHSSVIHVGSDPISRVCNGIIDNLIIYNRPLDSEDIYRLFTSEYEPEDDGNMMLRANFNNGIGNFNWSTIDITPAPLPGTPIVVKKADGSIMMKVSFIDPTTGKYIPYYKQVFTYDGSNTIQVSVGDIDYDFFNTGIYTQEGLKIAGVDDISPTLYDNVIEINKDILSEYIGKDLEIWYQPKDCYTVDFNVGQSNVCRITLGKSHGEPVTIIYESNPDIGQRSLVETVDLNTANNPNNQGFMYITKNPGVAEVLRVSTSPSQFVANGYNYAVIVLEVVDDYGNPISNADYEFTTKRHNQFKGFPAALDYGEIAPYSSPEYEDYIKRKNEYLSTHSEEEWYSHYGHFLGLNERAGRQIFTYKTREISPSDETIDFVTEKILVKDKVSGLGTEINVRLIIKSDYKI